MLVSVSHVARSECFLKEKPDCDSRPWSSWSQSCDYPCNALGTQTRRRLNEECYENCEPAEEKRPCSGTLPADCELSSWSAWSSCNFVDDLCAFSFAQRSTRYKSRKEGCGGTCSAVDYERSRQAACSNGGIPFPNYTCQCKENFYGACCEHEEDKGVEGKLTLYTLRVLVRVCVRETNTNARMRQDACI